MRENRRERMSGEKERKKWDLNYTVTVFFIYKYNYHFERDCLAMIKAAKTKEDIRS